MTENLHTNIQKFFKGQTIFLTGATGFLGKVLLEKLLRSCPDLGNICLLIRQKKGKTTNERFQDIFNYPCFDKLKIIQPNYQSKITLIDGDCSLPNLGLSKNNLEYLKNSITIIINVAANVKFDQPLRLCTLTNVKSVMELVQIAKEMPQLQAFVHVSTAYSHCYTKNITEDFYDVSMSAENLINILDAIKDDDTLDKMTPHILGKWANTYVFAKAIAEDFIRNKSGNLPITIVRPAIVTSSVAEPVPGWIDNFYGITGIVAGASLGVLRSLNANPDNVAQLVPVDYTVNHILAAAWDIGTVIRHNHQDIPIYNYVGSETNKIIWREFMSIIEKHAWNYPTNKVIWYYSFAIRYNTLWHKIVVFFLQTLVGYLVDFIFICVGKTPIATKNYKRIDKLLTLTSIFALNSWNFDRANVATLWRKMSPNDRKLFNFNMDNLDWNQYIIDSIIGGRIFLLKDPLSTIEKSKKKIWILGFAHYTIIILFWYFMYKLLMMIFN